VTTRNRIIRPRDTDHTIALLREAMRRRIAVTVGFWEVRKDDDGKPVKAYDPDTGRNEDTYVRTLRTVEFFNEEVSSHGRTVFTGVDRCPKNRTVTGAPWGTPGVRRVRADRVCELSFASTGYDTPNPYFLEQVRKHAEQQAGVRKWRRVLSMSDAELWPLIVGAADPLTAVAQTDAALSAAQL
jgi:hypothetical protein